MYISTNYCIQQQNQHIIQQLKPQDEHYKAWLAEWLAEWYRMEPGLLLPCLVALWRFYP